VEEVMVKVEAEHVNVWAVQLTAFVQNAVTKSPTRGEFPAFLPSAQSVEHL